MNFAVALANGRVPGVRIDPAVLNVDPTAASVEAARDRLMAALLRGDVSDATRTTLERAREFQQVTALTIGSPEFQRR
jgi:hypothetical protein